MSDEQRIRAMVRRTVYRAIGRPADHAPGQGRALVSGQDIEAAPYGGELGIPTGALITPLARQVAMERKVSLVERDSSAGVEGGLSAGAADARTRTVAVGGDHGGFELKNMIKRLLSTLGYAVHDVGTHSSAAVDYPDIAELVATRVAQGRAWRGIIVDGAGVGSCMAANKVRGVRAAACSDRKTAINSRSHNDANVLTLGSGIVDQSTALDIVRVWLETAAEGGRHARRVAKIMEIERRALGGMGHAVGGGPASEVMRDAV